MRAISPFESPKLRAAASGRTCVRCGADDGTVVGAHYTGLRQHLLGKGMGIKATDAAIADLCDSCHRHFDQPRHRKSVEASEEFLFLIVLTLHRRLVDGVVEVA